MPERNTSTTNETPLLLRMLRRGTFNGRATSTLAPHSDKEVPATLAPRRGAHLLRAFSSSDKTLAHYLDGYNIIRESHTPFNTSGAFCDVFLGNHPVYKKVVMKRPRMALNGSRGSSMKHFRTEAEIWSKLRHPNILQFIGVIEAVDHVWLISPFAANGSLPDYIKAHPEADRQKLVVQLIHAVKYLHRKGIVHGDIKGANILISTDIDVLLCDFGLAKFQDMKTVTSLKGAGTWHWSAPELFSEGASKTTASDVYAFGMTIYQILSGNIPFDGCPVPALVKAISDDKRPPKEPPTSVFGASYAMLWDIAEASWTAEPSHRPAMSTIQARFRTGVYWDGSPLDGDPTSVESDQDRLVQVSDALGAAKGRHVSSDSPTSLTAPHPGHEDLTSNTHSPPLMLQVPNESRASFSSSPSTLRPRMGSNSVEKLQAGDVGPLPMRSIERKSRDGPSREDPEGESRRPGFLDRIFGKFKSQKPPHSRAQPLSGHEGIPLEVASPPGVERGDTSETVKSDSKASPEDTFHSLKSSSDADPYSLSY